VAQRCNTNSSITRFGVFRLVATIAHPKLVRLNDPHRHLRSDLHCDRRGDAVGHDVERDRQTAGGRTMQADNLRALMEELNDDDDEAAALFAHIMSIIERASFVLQRQISNELRSRHTSMVGKYEF
jgi:hypothetical protein